MQVTMCAATKLVLHLAFANGSTHDFQLFKDSEMLLCQGVKVLADSGYQGLEREHECALTPFKRPKGGELSAFQKEANRALASMRVPVENVIRDLKVFRILGERYRGRRKRIQLQATIIAGFVNFNRMNAVAPYF